MIPEYYTMTAVQAQEAGDGEKTEEKGAKRRNDIFSITKSEWDEMMKQEVRCRYCGEAFAYETVANMILYCQKCQRHLLTECEYGFGPVTPCTVYLGEKEIARIVLKDRYVLVSEYFDFERELTGGYENLAAYSEAQLYIEPIIQAGGSK